MYSKEGNVIDRREMLRVKLKSLAAEAKLIRREEQHTWGVLRNELYLHRIHDVRRAARETHLAYGLIRGQDVRRIEPNAFSKEWRAPHWPAIEKMVKKYGPVGAVMPACTQPGYTPATSEAAMPIAA